jgi:hypothetical protein
MFDLKSLVANETFLIIVELFGFGVGVGIVTAVAELFHRLIKSKTEKAGTHE